MGELDGRVNLQVEAFIVESGGSIASSVEELTRLLAANAPAAT